MATTSMSVLLSTFLLVISAGVVSGLTCLECLEVVQPRHCHTAVSCPSQHLCGTEKVQTQSGGIAYNIGCRHKAVCSIYRNQTTSLNGRSFSPCLECCDGPLCNANTCGQPAYPSVRGPLCYQCDSYIDVAQCNHITQCATDEVCYIDQRLEYSDPLYTSGCKLKHTCTNTIHFARPAYVVGRRFLESQVTPVLCATCCDQDVCNRNCHNTHTSIDPTIGHTLTSKMSTISTTTDTTTHRTTPTTTSPLPPISVFHDCRDVYEAGFQTTGVYNISVRVYGQLKERQVYCDMDSPGGGWTVFQRRFNGSVDFYRNFSDYESGFGDLNGEFWLGLESVYWMTINGTSELMVNLTEAIGLQLYVRYGSFSLGSPFYYRLHVSSGSGTASSDQAGLANDAHNGQAFSTYDHDRDDIPSVHCAQERHAGYWYKRCNWSNLNGHYGGDYNIISSGFYWKPNQQLRTSQLAFRRMSN